MRSKNISGRMLTSSPSSMDLLTPSLARLPMNGDEHYTLHGSGVVERENVHVHACAAKCRLLKDAMVPLSRVEEKGPLITPL